MHSMDFEEFLWAKGYDSAFIERLYEKMVSITPLYEGRIGISLGVTVSLAQYIQ